MILDTTSAKNVESSKVFVNFITQQSVIPKYGFIQKVLRHAVERSSHYIPCPTH